MHYLDPGNSGRQAGRKTDRHVCNAFSMIFQELLWSVLDPPHVTEVRCTKAHIHSHTYTMSPFDFMIDA